ncbi:hypothetical protein B0J17DRAFT_305608 [Rhizoctonia solani]|nr:hypothetical protein B0J17DRAFT_305608 [Rhizoctonia solani]
MVAPPTTNFDIAVLEPEKHAAHFRILNIIGESPYHNSHTKDALMQSDSPIRPLELSLCEKQPASFFKRHPVEKDHLYPIESNSAQSSDIPFYNLLESLSVLRVSGAQIHRHKLTLHNQLTKLRLQQLNFGFDRTLATCLSKALSPATGLQDLEIIPVRTFPEFGVRPKTVAQKIILPQLKTLLIQDLCNNTLMTLLNSIAPGSHHLRLYLTRKCRMFYDIGGFTYEIPHFEDTCNLLRHTPVHTLCINAGFGNPWLSFSRLRGLLESMPALETFRSYGGEVDQNFWNALERPQHQGSIDVTFPHFISLHFSELGVRVTELGTLALKRMVSSHSSSLQRIVLERYAMDEGMFQVDLTEDQEIVAWLRENVLEFKLRKSNYIPREFREVKWRLW